MKTTNIAGLFFFIAAFFIQANAHATDPSASANGKIAVSSSVGGAFTLGSNGSSSSYAQNSESATAKIITGASRLPGYSVVNAGVSGATTTDSFGKAYNVSSGSGSGSALSTGAANTWVTGTVGIRGVTTGSDGGQAGTGTTNKIVAGTNEGSYVLGQTQAGFDTQLHFTRSASSIPATGFIGGTKESNTGLVSQATGYAGGTNFTHSLNGMNAAGIANIEATGQFFAGARLTTTIGAITAP